MTTLLAAACTNSIHADPTPAPETLAFTPIADEPPDAYPWPAHTSTSHSNEVRAGTDEKPIAELEFSTKCQALIARAELEATVLGAPTLAASFDKGGDAQVVLSYDLVNLQAMKNARHLVNAKCQLDQITATAKKMAGLSARKLEVKGLRVKVDFIDRHRSRFNRMRSELRTGVASGTIKEKSQARVLKTLDALLERTDTFRTKARLQGTVDLETLPSYSQIEAELLRATETLHGAQKNSDIARNIRFLISGGYTAERNEVPGNNTYKTDGFGKATVSVRLGILDPKWAFNQETRMQVTLYQYYEAGTGMLWQIGETYRKNRIALQGYREKEALLGNKLAKSRNRRSAISENDIGGRMLPEIEIIKLKSELAEVKTNIAALVKLQAKLEP